MPRSEQLTVQLANQPGTLAQVAQALGKARVNIRALTVFEGRAKILTDDPRQGREALQNEGLFASIEDCLTVEVVDRPGALGEICRKVADAGINIEYAYTGLAETAGQAVAVMVVSDLEKASRITG